MRLDTNQLKEFTLDVAAASFGPLPFQRRELMQAVEAALRQKRLWEPWDDDLSASAGTKSRGMANIDYRLSDLANEGRLVSLKRNTWTVNQRLLPPRPRTR